MRTRSSAARAVGGEDLGEQAHLRVRVAELEAELARLRSQIARAAPPTLGENDPAVALLANLMNEAPVGFVFFDGEFRYRVVNKYLAEINGIPIEEHIGRTVAEVLPSLTAQATEMYRTVVETGKPVIDREFRGETPKAPGHMRYWSESWYPVHAFDGRWLGVGAIISEITERKRAEEALRRSESYLAEAQRLSHIGSWAWNVVTNEIAFWSPEHYRILGFDPELGPVTIEAIRERIHPEDRPRLESVFEWMSHEKRDFAVDLRALLPDGSVRYLHSIGHPVLNEAGDLVEFTGALMDVSERMRAEQELQRSFNQSRALTARLQNVREEERKKIAREIHDELGQALTGLKLEFSSLVRALPAEHRQPQRVASILNIVSETIKSVRRISTELRPGILDDLGLIAAIEWAAEEFQGRTGTVCRLDVPREAAIDQERATAIFRITQETLTNVARHADATHVHLRFGSYCGTLTLEIRDNGKGVSEEQISSVRSLGIAGMRERALLLGGEFTISGEPGRGTVVSVRIPPECASQVK